MHVSKAEINGLDVALHHYKIFIQLLFALAKKLNKDDSNECLCLTRVFIWGNEAFGYAVSAKSGIMESKMAVVLES